MKPHTMRIGYDLPTTKAKRACGFGIGDRFNTPMGERSKRKYYTIHNKFSLTIIIINLERSPPPGSYETKSDFAKPGTAECKYRKPHIYTFGISHENYKKVYQPH